MQANYAYVFLHFRPQSLAWEVRKQMSPGKCSPTVSSRRSPSPAAVRFLNFSQQNLASFSWADRVRGFSNQPADKHNKESKKFTTSSSRTNLNASSSKANFPSPVQEAAIEEHPSKENDDGEGWEVVNKKGRSRSKGSNLSTSSGSSLQNHKKQHVIVNGKNGTISPTAPDQSESRMNCDKLDRNSAKSSTGSNSSSNGVKESRIENDTPNQNNRNVENNQVEEKLDNENTSATQNISEENSQTVFKEKKTSGKGWTELPEQTLTEENDATGEDKDGGGVFGGGSIRLENLSRSSTIIEEYLDYNNVTTEDAAGSLMKSTSSFTMETIDLAFNLTEDELQMKEEQEKVMVKGSVEISSGTPLPLPLLLECKVSQTNGRCL